jgi:hypothetical protein
MIQKDKLTTNYTLVIRPEYAGLIPLVASMNGWDGESDAKEFLAATVNDLVVREIRYMIRGALERYYGVSQAALIAQAVIDYDGSAETVTSWEVIEEET